ncbi:hypothetical protein MWU78_01565 [Arenibacter sp. F26102]|nr:hypothetical protein [Arenibacter sp. F26102]
MHRKKASIGQYFKHTGPSPKDSYACGRLWNGECFIKKERGDSRLANYEQTCQGFNPWLLKGPPVKVEGMKN